MLEQDGAAATEATLVAGAGSDKFCGSGASLLEAASGVPWLALLLVTLLAGWTIRQWKVSELQPHGYRWNCRDEGFLLLF